MFKVDWELFPVDLGRKAASRDQDIQPGQVYSLDLRPPVDKVQIRDTVTVAVAVAKFYGDGRIYLGGVTPTGHKYRVEVHRHSAAVQVDLPAVSTGMGVAQSIKQWARANGAYWRCPLTHKWESPSPRGGKCNQ